jgi:hypothetical protein
MTFLSSVLSSESYLNIIRPLKWEKEKNLDSTQAAQIGIGSRLYQPSALNITVSVQYRSNTCLIAILTNLMRHVLDFYFCRMLFRFQEFCVPIPSRPQPVVQGTWGNFEDKF